MMNFSGDNLLSNSILVIEDEIDVLNLLTQILKTRQHHVIQALGGRQALDILARERPDLILLDLAMPGIDGLQILAAIREMAHLKDVRIVVVTARGQMARQASSYQVDDIFMKPVRPGQLLSAIERYL
jgi:CheY-like chemotaxis protein